MLSTPSLGITSRLHGALRGPRPDLSTPSLGITISNYVLYHYVVFSDFQLPLSGSLGYQYGEYLLTNAHAFNSLSRDHTVMYVVPDDPRHGFLSTPSLGITLSSVVPDSRRESIFQLPLSGSQDYLIGKCLPTRHKTFNSLSRDHMVHGQSFYEWFTDSFQLPLSGSRSLLSSSEVLSPSGAFNSLSRDHRASWAFRLMEEHRAFNSLSRDHKIFARSACRFHRVSFNSLSRDHTDATRCQIQQSRAFNSLSRDHRPAVPRKVASSLLSTPSLGITIDTGTSTHPLCRPELSTPSLGITESDLQGISAAIRMRFFQLPLSGSQ